MSSPRVVRSVLKTLPPATGTSYLHGYSGTVSGTTYNWGTGDFSTSYASKVGVEETMTDEVGTPTDFNDCTHVKKVWKFPLNTIVLVGRSVGENGQTGKVCEAVSSYTVSAGTSTGPQGNNSFPVWDSEANAKARATAKLQLGVRKSSTNIGVFLGELKDFKEVYEMALKPFRLKKEFLTEQGMRHAQSRFQRVLRKGVTTEQGIRWMASTDLFYQFAIKPFLADIAELARFSERMRRERDRLLNSKAIQRARAVVTDTGTGSLTQEGTSNHWTYQTRLYERRTSAWIMYQWKLGQVPQVSDLRLGSEILGLGNPLSIVWELIPFSFLVDYFVKVGDTVQAMDGSLIEIPYTVVKQGTSVKKTFRSVTKTSFDRGINRSKFRNVSPPPDVYGEYEETTYTRKAEVLSLGTVPLPSFSLPNLRQVANLAELIYLRGKQRGH